MKIFRKIFRLGVFMTCAMVSMILFADDEVGCSARYHTDYSGYLISEDASQTNATVSARISQRAKNGVATAVLTFHYLASGFEHTFICGNIHMPESVVFTSSRTNESFRATVTAYAIVGSYNGQHIVLASKKGDGSTELEPLDAVSGTWTFVAEVFDPNISGSEVSDPAEPMFATFSIQIKKRGRTKTIGYLPNGRKISKTFSIEDVGDSLILPVSVTWKNRRGGETVAFDLVFYKDDLMNPVLSRGKWFSTIQSDSFEYNLRLLEFGLPGIERKEVRNREFEFDSPAINDARFISANEKTGVLRGSFVYYYEDSRGRTRRKKGSINGVAVDGVCYGVGIIKNILTFSLEVGEQ